MAVSNDVPHAVFLLNFMMSFFSVGVFTKSFLFGSFLQLVVKVMIFNLILPTYPLKFEESLELNLYFSLAQLFATYVGVCFSNFLYLPPLVTFPRIKKFLPVFDKEKFWWGWGSLFKIAFILTIFLNVIPRLVYDYGISVFNPGDFIMWGIITTGVLFLMYFIAYYGLKSTVGKCQPFYNTKHLQITMCVLLFTELFVLTVFWCLNEFVTTDVVDLLIAVAIIWLIVLICGHATTKYIYCQDRSLLKILKSRMKGEIY